MSSVKDNYVVVFPTHWHCMHVITLFQGDAGAPGLPGMDGEQGRSGKPGMKVSIKTYWSVLSDS